MSMLHNSRFIPSFFWAFLLLSIGRYAAIQGMDPAISTSLSIAGVVPLGLLSITTALELFLNILKIIIWIVLTYIVLPPLIFVKYIAVDIPLAIGVRILALPWDEYIRFFLMEMLAVLVLGLLGVVFLLDPTHALGDFANTISQVSH